MRALLKRVHLTANELWHFLIDRDPKTARRLSLATKLGLRLRGFRDCSHVLYELGRNDCREYLSDLGRIRSIRINTRKNPRLQYRVCVNNKLFFSAMFAGQASVPRALAFVDRGVPVALDPLWREASSAGVSEVCRRLGTPLVVKPVAGTKGKGVHIIRFDNGRVLFDDEASSDTDALDRIGKLDDYLITDFFVQGSFARSLYPGTTNTIRLVTLIDPETRSPFIPIAVQRIGTRRSAPVDNWSRGGISAEIDLDTGEIRRGATYPYNKASLEWLDRHPETDAQFAGLRIPGWTTMRDEMLTLAGRHPYLRCVGWDIVLQDDGYSIIEGNSTTDVDLLQIHRPLLRDARVRKFFKHYGVI